VEEGIETEINNSRVESAVESAAVEREGESDSREEEGMAAEAAVAGDHETENEVAGGVVRHAAANTAVEVEVNPVGRNGGAEKQHARTSSFSSVGGSGGNAERDNWSSCDSRDRSCGEKHNYVLTLLFSSVDGDGGNAEIDREGGGRDNRSSGEDRSLEES